MKNNLGILAQADLEVVPRHALLLSEVLQQSEGLRGAGTNRGKLLANEGGQLLPPGEEVKEMS